MAYINGKQIINVLASVGEIENELSATSENAVANSAVANNVTNALKGMASGEIVRVDDVSPVEHIAKVKLSGNAKLTKCGKNILDISKAGLITVNAEGVQRSGVKFSKPATYTFSGIVSDLAYKVITDGVYGEFKTFTGDIKFTVTIAENQELIIYCGTEGMTFDNLTNAQLELGETATDYEPYNGETYTPDDNGVCNVLSVSPTMTLLTDTDGASIELEYNRDINAVIADLYSKLT